ncbi:MAG: diadenylate cyclase CdaA [Pseudomonadota bacterium]|nr:diadenylate cyclase CdaA [Pseudomonadota bacterium]
MDSIWGGLRQVLGTSGLTGVSVLFQVSLIITLLYFLYARLIKNSPAEKTVKGITCFLVIIWITAEIFTLLHLRILSAMLRNLLLLILLSFVVIFQPELRRLMARLGSSLTWVSQHTKKQINDKTAEILAQSIQYWQDHHTGALIVLEHQESVSAVTTDGILLNADLSVELLINLFFVNTPLHDGAVVIKNGKVISAGVILPLTRDVSLNWKYGTRHRAAIGVSENTDALVIVVSEENGDISFVKEGKIHTFHSLRDLSEKLATFLSPLNQKIRTDTLWHRIKDLFVKK